MKTKNATEFVNISIERAKNLEHFRRLQYPSISFSFQVTEIQNFENLKDI